MNRILCLLFIASTFLFTSCNFTEEIYFNDDGSGKMSFKFDGSQMMTMMGDKLMENGEGKKRESVDSLIVFKDIFEEKKDSISKLSAKEQADLKKLEDFSMHMLMNAETKKMEFTLMTDFKDISKVGDVMKSFQDASNMQQGKSKSGSTPPNPLSSSSEASEVSYGFKNNKFTRQAVVKDRELLEQSMDSLEQMKTFLAGSSYTLKYHFPKRVKSVSDSTALLSQDGKTMTVQFDFLQMMKDPESLNIEVELVD